MKKFTLFLLSALLPLLFLMTGCAAAGGEYRTADFFAMDTVITVRLARHGMSDEAFETVTAECERIVTDLEQILSAHDPDSELYRLNESDAEFTEVSEPLMTAVSCALSVSRLTDGAYDCTLGVLSDLWNVTGGGPVPAEEDIADALRLTGFRNITADEKRGTVMRPVPGIRIDLGSIGKGMAADALIEYLKTTDAVCGVVSVGGTVGVFGEKPSGEPFEIAVRDPEQPDGIIGFLRITSGFVAVSGDYERWFEENGVRYHHILDPRTGYPADSGLSSAVVHSADGITADALSTALFAAGTDTAVRLCGDPAAPGFDALLISHDGTVTSVGSAVLVPKS